MRDRNLFFYDADDAGGSADATNIVDDKAEFSFIDPKTGKFSEGWKEHLPEEIRGEKLLDTVVDIGGMAKSLVHHAKMVGKDKIVLPNEKSSESDWNAFFDSIGRPKTADEYEMKRADDVPEEMWDSGVVEKILPELHKRGFTKAQVDYLAEIENERLRNMASAYKEAEQSQYEAALKALQDEWGNAFPERKRLANRVVHDTTEEGEMRSHILDRIGNDPVVLKWVSELGMKLVETKSIDTTVTMKSPKELAARAEELRNTRGYMDGTLKQTDPIKYERITSEIRDIYKEMHPD